MVCHQAQYKAWAKDNCRKFCGFCGECSCVNSIIIRNGLVYGV